MPTATATVGRRSTCRLTLEIDGQPYSVRVEPLGDAAECFVQYRLAKRDGTHYTVSVPLDGIPVCDCPDFTYRREQVDRAACKHCRALRALGLLNMTWVEREEVVDGDLAGGGPPPDRPAEAARPMTRAIAIEPDVAGMLGRATVSGDRLDLSPLGQLPREDYERVNRAIEGLGGRWDRKARAHVFDRPVEGLLAEALGSGSVAKNPLAFLPTPAPVVARMIALAKLDRRRPGEPQKLSVLEPSAGDGAIVRALEAHSRHVDFVRAVELDRHRADRIPIGKVAIDVLVGDFLALPGEDLFEDAGPFHRVLMNPPFTAPGEPHAYWLHVMRAYDLMAEGGRLVAVTPVGWRHATKPGEVVMFRDFVMSQGASALVEELPEGAFRESGTGVRACLVVLDK